METITAATQAVIPTPQWLTQAPYDYQLKAAGAILNKEANPWVKVGRFESVKLNISVLVSPKFLIIESTSPKLIDSIESPSHDSTIVICSPECSNKFPVNWFWRRVIIDEPEVISKRRSWRLPKGAHTLLLTANLEEITAIPKSKGALGELFHYVRDMTKTFGIELAPKMVVKVGQDFYAECTKTPSYYANIHLGPKCRVADTLKQVLGVNKDTFVAINIGDYVTTSKLMKLASEHDMLEPFLEGVVGNATTKIKKFEEKLEAISSDVTTPMDEITKTEHRLAHLKEEYAKVTEELMKAILTDKASGAGWDFKVKQLTKIIEKLPETGKAIVFSQYMHSGIKHLLDTGIKLIDLTSPMSPNQLNTIMNEIVTMKDKVVVMLNPDHYGRGLNMQYVDTIIVMHATDKETMQQWIGRGYRIGRTNNLNVEIILNDEEADEIVEDVGSADVKKGKSMDDDDI
eukprot:gene19559-26241_t